MEARAGGAFLPGFARQPLRASALDRQQSSFDSLPSSMHLSPSSPPTRALSGELFTPPGSVIKGLADFHITSPQPSIPTFDLTSPEGTQQLPATASQVDTQPAEQQQQPPQVATQPAEQQQVPPQVATQPAQQQQVNSPIATQPAEQQQVPPQVALQPAQQQQQPPQVATQPAEQQQQQQPPPVATQAQQQQTTAAPETPDELAELAKQKAEPLHAPTPKSTDTKTMYQDGSYWRT